MSNTLLVLPARKGGFGIVALYFISVFFGIVAGIFPWWFVVSAVIAICFFIIAWFFPEFAVVLLLASLFGVLPESLMPKLALGGGELKPEDLGIPVLFFILILKDYKNFKILISPLRHYVFPLGFFVGSALLSALIAVLYKTSPVKDVFNELRPYFTWLFLLVFFMAINNEKKILRFKVLLLILALILAAGVMVQSLSGVSIFGRGQEVRQLWSTGGGVAGVMRSTTPGMFLMTGVLIYIFAAYAKEQIKRPFLLCVFGAILSGGILVGFGRGMWLSVIIGIVMLAFFSRKAAYTKLIIVFGLVCGISFGGLLIVKPDYVSAIADRFLSVGEELERGSSFGRRKEENFYAIQKIEQSPLLGVGLGGRYKPENSETLAWPEQSRYIHNAYMKVAVKTGLPGLFAVLFFIAVTIWRTWDAARFRSGHKDPALAFAAFWVILTTMVFTSMTQPNFVASNGVASIALAIFLSEALRRDSQERRNDDEQS
ncbi:MAG: O-antigen ligase family protein [bacterium]|nr:O-antigen ligase family protein [bacterium]